MDPTPTPPTADDRVPATTPRRRAPSAVVVWGLAGGIALAVAVVAAWAWLQSEHALRTVVRVAVEQAGGRLAVDGASGTLAGEVRVGRIAWRDEGTSVVADGVALRFSPARLLHGLVAIREAHIARLAVTLAEGDGAPPALPEAVGLPIAVDVARLAIDAVEWRSGERTGTLADLALAYRGDADAHAVRGLDVTAPGARLRGDATVAARKPFATQASLALDLDSPHPRGRVEAKVDGTLEALAVEAVSSVAGVDADARLALAPLAAQPLVSGTLRARDVDLAALDSGLPATRLAVAVDAKPTAGGFAGTVSVRNADAGPIDRGRVPLAALAAAFAFDGNTVALTGVDARLPGGGAASGAGTIELGSLRNRWSLRIDALDLARIHSSLVATALAGRIDADVDGAWQRIVADVAQDDLSLAFDARHDGRTVVAERFAASARGGTLSGRGRIALDGERAFVAEATAQRFDPSRFGAFPAGALDGTLRVEGTAGRVPRADVDVVVARGSRLAGLPMEGRARGRVDARSIADLDARIELGGTRGTARGSVGRRGEPLAIEVASDDLAQLAPLLPEGVPVLAGTLEARARVLPDAEGADVSIDARARRLRVADVASFATLRVDARARHAAPLDRPGVEALRDVVLDASATGLVVPQGSLASATAALRGSAAAHTLAFEVAEDGRRLTGRLEGALAGPWTPATSWRGRVLALSTDAVAGFGRIALASPVDVELAADRVIVGAARLAGGGAEVAFDGLAWRAGRLETRGRFTGLAVSSIAKGAGYALPWQSDLVIGGSWDLASAPHWRGTLSVARERGDVYVDDGDRNGSSRIALDLQTLQLDATIDGPRLAAKGEARARVHGAMLLDATLQAPEGAPHPLDAASRLRGMLRAHLPSLATLQPWIGTAARVRGQAIAEINLAGTLGDPAFTGQVVGYGLGVDMPQHGIYLADGRLRVVSSAEGLRLEEFEFGAGAGRFTATGTIALPGPGGATAGATRIAWRAEDFLLLNHPDRRLVLDGEGTFSREGGRWLLAGRVRADEGRVAYRSTADTTLADDIVVVGRERPTRSAAGDGLQAPLDLDLAIEFGRNFRFEGEGLSTRLGGRLQLVSRRGEPITAKGTIRAVQGTYSAFGQRLAIDRGRLIFDGPIDNPALDVVALRRNLAVEAGVQITGTVRAPLVRLTSEPPVPDSEKLSWLLTGGPPGSATQREALALQAAQAALAGRGGKTLTQQFAQNVGVDDISLQQRGGGSADDPLAGQVVAVGKRITDRLYVAFEQGLTVATNALRMEYVLSRYFTVSAFAGTTSGVELRFRRTWR